MTPDTWPIAVAARRRAGPWYHGTHAEFRPGDMIEPGHTPVYGPGPSGHVYLTDSLPGARMWAQDSLEMPHPVEEQRAPHVYEVEPSGPVERDPRSEDHHDHRSSSPLRVIREAARTRPPRGYKLCGCCGGSGEHIVGPGLLSSECDPCDGFGQLHENEHQEYCPGQPRPRRRHWREASQQHEARMIDLYHRTTPEAADSIMRERQMLSKENRPGMPGGPIYFSTSPRGQAEGYGTAMVHVRVPEHIAELDDEFPDGEQHYAVPGHVLRPEHFIAREAVARGIALTASADRPDWIIAVAAPPRRESVQHILTHYKPYDFGTWDEVRANYNWHDPQMREFEEDVRRNGVQRPIPIDYEQAPPQVRNGHTRLLAAERAGVTDVPVRQHEWMDPDDPHPVTGEPNVSDADWFADNPRHSRTAGMPRPDYDPADPLPVGRGLFWRAHLNDRPLDEEHARSVSLNTPWRNPRSSGGEAAGQRGYSAFRTPHQLGRYMDQMGWLDEPGMMRGRDVIAFHGEQVGRGVDNEPLVVPKANPHCCGQVIHSRMSWNDLEGKIWGEHASEVPHHQEYVSDPVPKAIERHWRRHESAKYDLGPVRYSHHEEEPGHHRFDAHDEWGNNVAYAHADEHPDHVFLDSVYVRPGARGHGIASKLVDNVIGHFPGRDIRLKPQPFSHDQWNESGHEGMDEDQLRGFYQSRGFQDYEPSASDTAWDKWEHMVRHGKAREAAWMPTQRIFGPTHCLDHRLFAAGKLKPEVSAALLARLRPVLSAILGPQWQLVTRAYLAGSQASLWTNERCEGNGDLDVLVGVAASHARELKPWLSTITDAQLNALLNKGFREGFNRIWEAFGARWDLTGHSCPYDITTIRPYAAWDLTNDRWAVEPPSLPDWGPESFAQGPALFQEARALIGQVRAILRLPEPFRTEEARRIWSYIHAGRDADFSETGRGWQGTGNVLEKALDQASGHLVDRLKELAHAHHLSGPAALGQGMTTADLPELAHA